MGGRFGGLKRLSIRINFAFQYGAYNTYMYSILGKVFVSGNIFRCI